MSKQPQLLTDIFAALQDEKQRKNFNRKARFKCKLLPIIGKEESPQCKALDTETLKKGLAPFFHVPAIDKYLLFDEVQTVQSPFSSNTEKYGTAAAESILLTAFAALDIFAGKRTKIHNGLFPTLKLLMRNVLLDMIETGSSIKEATAITSEFYSREINA